MTGQHDGYVTDFKQCKYDPVADQDEHHCGLPYQAAGTGGQQDVVRRHSGRPVPTPADDNGFTAVRPAKQISWGRTRGTKLDTIATSTSGVPAPFEAVMDQVALNTRSPSLATSSFVNDAGSGQGGWKALSYPAFAEIMRRGKELNDTAFAKIDSNDPDLRTFERNGRKMITFHGLADPNVSPQSAINYFTRVSDTVEGDARQQEFHRLFLVPGRGHCGGTGTVGTSNPPLVNFQDMFNVLVNWVEKGEAPTSVVATTADKAASRPICVYPSQVKYQGGDVNSASSYACQ